MNLVTLLRRLFMHVTELLKEDAALAKVELEGKLRHLAVAAAMLATAALIGIGVLAVVVAAAILGLDRVVAPWLSALIVAGVLAVLSAVCLFIGRAEIRAALPLVPTDAITTFKENIVWTKTLTTSRERS